MKRALAFAMSVVLAATPGCTPTPPRHEVRIALVAPFEGRQRAVGYAVFPGLREAIREHAGAAARVSFVAYNDDGDADAAERAARAVVLDPDVVAVIGHFGAGTTRRAAQIYADAGLPFIAFSSAEGPAPAPAGAVHVPAEVWTPDSRVNDAHARIAGSSDPSELFIAGYGVTQWALRAIDAASVGGGAPTRQAVANGLARVDLRP